MSDFLKKDVGTSLCGRYLAAGVRLRIDTNSESILKIASANLAPWEFDRNSREAIRLRLWVEDEDSADEERNPYYRGLGHLVYSGYGDRSSLVINLRDRYGAGRFTRKLAEDSRYWKTELFPSLLGIIGPSVGLTSLHCACVAWRDSGLLLVGDSGTGKSTLSLALAQAGLDFLSDDRTLVSEERGKLRAWAFSREMKQRVEAIDHFPALRDVECHEVWKEDSVLRFDPVQVLGVAGVPSCEPRCVVFLEREAGPAFALEGVTPQEAAFQLERGLHQESPDSTERQRRTIEALAQRRCYRLRYGGDPHTVAGTLRHVFLENGSMEGKEPKPTVSPTCAAGVSSDPLKRFRATCLRYDALLMGRHLRVETDSPVISRRIAEAFSSVEPAQNGHPQFVWRIACEPREASSRMWPSMTAFCHDSLRYISLGQYSFIAADLRAREAIGVLPEALCEDNIGFSTVFLSSLLHLTAPALGLMPVSAACVARAQNGLLLFGPPNSGKTTAAYCGKKLGLEFHSDQVSFLELHAGAVHAWGDFWPAAFRPETTRFFPEISTLARPFQYRDRDFLCVDKESLSGAHRGRVTPVACIFLERKAASAPRFIPLPQRELPGQVFTDAGSREDRSAILALLGRVPAYRLLYDDDPSIAALFFRSVLDAHELMEQRA